MRPRFHRGKWKAFTKCDVCLRLYPNRFVKFDGHCDHCEDDFKILEVLFELVDELEEMDLLK